MNGRQSIDFDNVYSNMSLSGLKIDNRKEIIVVAIVNFQLIKLQIIVKLTLRCWQRKFESTFEGSTRGKRLWMLDFTENT